MRRSILLTIALGGLLLAGLPPGAVGTAAAQEPSRLERVQAELPADAARTLQQTVERAEERGLPTDPLIDKALEGTAKAVAPEMILSVVDGLAEQLARAQDLLRDGTAPVPSDVSAVADALGRGVPSDAVRELRSEAGEEGRLALAVHTLADLLDRGVPVESALGVLEALQNRNGEASELRDLPAAVDRLMRQGMLPDQAAASVAAAVRAGRPPTAAGPPRGRGPPDVRRGGPPDQPPIPRGAGPPTGRGNDRGQGQGQGQGRGSGNGSGSGGSGSGG